MSNKPERSNLPVKRSSSLSSLQPIDTSPFKNTSGSWIVWGSIFLTWLVSLLPWRQWSPAPDILLLTLAFWILHEPRRVSLVWAFSLGILIDVHDAHLFGGQALAYVLAAYGVMVLSRRLLLFEPVVQLMHLIPVFIVANAIPVVIQAWISGEWVGWTWVLSAVLTAMLWPLADFLLFLPHRRLDDADDGSS